MEMLIVPTAVITFEASAGAAMPAPGVPTREHRGQAG